MKFLIPAGTVVELLQPDRSWQPHTTERSLEFEQYLAFGIGTFTFRSGEQTLRVETGLVKGEWGR